MSAPSAVWIWIECSGVRWVSSFVCGEVKRTPDSETEESFARETIWKPPLKNEQSILGRNEEEVPVGEEGARPVHEFVETARAFD